MSIAVPVVRYGATVAEKGKNLHRANGSMPDNMSL
jgi:hypothetical protein